MEQIQWDSADRSRTPVGCGAEGGVGKRRTGSADSDAEKSLAGEDGDKVSCQGEEARAAAVALGPNRPSTAGSSRLHRGRPTASQLRKQSADDCCAELNAGGNLAGSA